MPDKIMSKSNGIAKVRKDRGQGAVQSKAPSGKMPKSDGIAGVRGNWSGGGGDQAAIQSKAPVGKMAKTDGIAKVRGDVPWKGNSNAK